MDYAFGKYRTIEEYLKLVGMEGVEPPRLSAVDFESTTSAIPSHSRKFGSPGGDCAHDLTLIRSVL